MFGLVLIVIFVDVEVHVGFVGVTFADDVAEEACIFVYFTYEARRSGASGFH